MMRPVLCLAASLLIAAPALAQQMNAELFHQRATKLKAKGPLALLHKAEIKALMTEGNAAGQAAKARRLEAEKSGKPRPYCPPPGKMSLNSDEFMKGLGAIPQADRKRMTMTDATVRILAAKYPCPR